ncbi:hypothetical protein HN588_18055 [Candidatus Bathyarchaeota archaeon]|jgi:hypothetical protein|nr:hypothetical protein [Candidatus Bathyarchaeota archaeon]
MELTYSESNQIVYLTIGAAKPLVRRLRAGWKSWQEVTFQHDGKRYRGQVSEMVFLHVQPGHWYCTIVLLEPPSMISGKRES